MQKFPKRIHFMGIGGSGMSGVAVLAKLRGFKVTGCNLDDDSPYLAKVRKEKIPVFKGHAKDHLKNTDILVITPAVLYQNSDNPEYLEAKTAKKVLLWNKFMGEYLLKDQDVVAISGTHGKGTTTAMAALVFEKAKKDPNVLIGATILDWQSNFRVGESNVFIIEADEFYEKFLDFRASKVIINNIEFDHPDYFKGEKELLLSFQKLIYSLPKEGVLIVNLDSQGIGKLLRNLNKEALSQLKIYGYTLENRHIPGVNILKAKIGKLAKDYTEFSVSADELGLNGATFRLKIPGVYNISNALGVIILSRLYGISTAIIAKTLFTFAGLDRRLELIGEKGNIKVYDDYAHHPTAVKATLKALRQKYPQKRIWAVIEPHSFSRTKTLLKNYKNVFDDADKVVVVPVYKARDSKDFGVSGQSIVDVANHKDATYFDSFNKTVDYVLQNKEANDVILVMGAGKSFQLARSILKKL